MSKEAAIPRHVAIIMDGNGRWARQRGLPRIKGHEEGANSVRSVVRACRDMGVQYLTLYAFSVENWVRPAGEVRGLMHLLSIFLKNEVNELHSNEARLRVIGRIEDLPKALQKELKKVMDATAHYTKRQVILALSYGARTELTRATQLIAEKVKAGELEPGAIDESTVAAHLYAPDIPDPDYMIRTSGEMRLSNFMLWQLSYAELYVTDVLWPDFREEQFREAIAAFGKRKRRFGDIESK